MSERKLATIRIIDTLEPIENADRIEKCILKDLGWQFVVRKNEFEIGDFCVFFETDSILPGRDWSEFMRPRKFKVKIAKFKGVVSQGLALAILDIPELKGIDLKEGMDVTEILGVKKYLTETERKELFEIEKERKSKFHKYMMKFRLYRNVFGKKLKGQWPEWIDKTNEERIQNFNYFKLLKEFGDKKLYVTEKIDYQSVTFFTKTEKFLNIFKKKYFGVCTRNIWKKSPDNSLYWRIAKKYDIKKIMMKYKVDLIIQAEQGNPSVQKNRYGINDEQMWIFNIILVYKNIQYHMNYDQMSSFCKIYNLPIVPLIDKFYLPINQNTLIRYAKGMSLISPAVEREGIVVRYIKNGKKILSFKVLNEDYLLKHGD